MGNRERGTLTISQQSFAEELVKNFRVTSVQSVPLRVGVTLKEIDEDEEAESWPFRELVDGFNVVGHFDTPRYFERSLICCELLFHAESHSPDSGARYSCVH